MGTPTACLYATIAYGVHEINKLLPISPTGYSSTEGSLMTCWGSGTLLPMASTPKPSRRA